MCTLLVFFPLCWFFSTMKNCNFNIVTCSCWAAPLCKLFFSFFEGRISFYPMFRWPITICVYGTSKLATKVSSFRFFFLLPFTKTIKFNFVCKWKLIFQKLFDFAMSINNSGCCVEKVLILNHNAFYTQSTYTLDHGINLTQSSKYDRAEWCNKFTCTHATGIMRHFDGKISSFFLIGWGAGGRKMIAKRPTNKLISVSIRTSARRAHSNEAEL